MKDWCLLLSCWTSAAFDTVDHHILWLGVVQLLGIKDSVLNWLTSYLSDRSYFGHLNYETRVPTKIYHGVLQGSVFGPILIILYILLLGSIIRKPKLLCWWHQILSINGARPNSWNSRLASNQRVWITRLFLQLNSDKTYLTHSAQNTWGTCFLLKH